MFKEGLSEFVLVPVFVLLVSIVSILFYWFNISNRKQLPSTVYTVPVKKTKKKKSPSLKIDKTTNLDKDDSGEKVKEVRHIEIKDSPILIDDNYRKSTDSDVDLHSIKPILKNADESVVTTDNETEQFTWNKVPKDEIEIIRSRHSSVVSDYKDEQGDVKLTKKQRKRLNAKLKSLETRKIDNNSQGNNSAIKSNVSKVEVDVEEPVIQPVNRELIYNDVDQTSNKIDFAEQDDNHDNNGSGIDNKATSIKDTALYDELKSVKMLLDQRANENNKLHNEIQNLKRTNEQLIQKTNESHQVRNAAISLEKDNKLLNQKNSELERTLVTLRNDMSNSVQKANNLENQLHRINSEKNQERSYMKENMDRLQCVINKKEQSIQNLNSEMNSYKEQINSQVQELQEMSSNSMSIQSVMKEKESIIKQIEEKLKNQYAINGRTQNELEKLQKTHNIFLLESKKKQEQSDTLVSSLQYQIDDLQKERQGFIDFDEIDIDNLKKENERLKQQCLALMQQTNAKSSDNTPNQLQSNNSSVKLESEECRRLIQIASSANQSLQDKSDEYESLKQRFHDREKELLSINSKLEEKQQQYRKELASLKEYVTEFTTVSSNSKNDINLLKTEVTTKTLALEKMENILKNLENSVEQEHAQYKEKIRELEQQNESLRSASGVDNGTHA